MNTRTYNFAPLDRIWQPGALPKWRFDWKEYLAGLIAFGLAVAFVIGVMVATGEM